MQNLGLHYCERTTFCGFRLPTCGNLLQRPQERNPPPHPGPLSASTLAALPELPTSSPLTRLPPLPFSRGHFRSAAATSVQPRPLPFSRGHFRSAAATSVQPRPWRAFWTWSLRRPPALACSQREHGSLTHPTAGFHLCHASILVGSFLII